MPGREHGVRPHRTESGRRIVDEGVPDRPLACGAGRVPPRSVPTTVSSGEGCSSERPEGSAVDAVQRAPPTSPERGFWPRLVAPEIRMVRGPLQDIHAPTEVRVAGNDAGQTGAMVRAASGGPDRPPHERTLEI